MRIFYLTDGLSLAGGADLHLREVIEAFAAAYPGQVSVAFGGRQGGCEPPAGVAAQRFRALAAPGEDRRGLDELARLVEDADVVHAQNVVNPAALSLVARSGKGLVTVQDHRVFCPGRGKLTATGGVCRRPMNDKICAPCFDEPGYAARIIALTRARREALEGAGLIVLSRYMARELAAVGLPGAEVIPPWCEVGRGASRDRGADRCFLLAGRLVSHKAPLLAARAYLAATPRLPLEVAGKGAEAEELARLVGARATMLGWLARGELRRRLGQVRALLFAAAWQEPFGIVAVEALAAGTPVVAMVGGGAEDWIVPSGGCLPVPRGDVGAMAEAIQRLDADAAFAARLGEAGRDFVARTYAREPLQARLEARYRRAAGNL